MTSYVDGRELSRDEAIGILDKGLTAFQRALDGFQGVFKIDSIFDSKKLDKFFGAAKSVVRESQIALKQIKEEDKRQLTHLSRN